MLKDGRAKGLQNSLGIEIDLKIMEKINPYQKKHIAKRLFLSTVCIFHLLLTACIVRPEYLDEYNSIASIPSESAEAFPGQETPTPEENNEPDNEFVLPVFSGEPVITLNGGIPSFQVDENAVGCYVRLSELDELGRCGAANACLGRELLATEERGPIGMVKPSGWHTVRYPFIEGQYLYNRCHLIAYSLSGINADEQNLITGTRFLNATSMLKIEQKLLSYILRTGNHIQYLVTPRYNGDDLLATGVQIEAWSIEDQGKGICINEFCFNIQPGVIIDYSTGESWAEEQQEESQRSTEDYLPIKPAYVPSEGVTYVLNKGRMRFHLPTCPDIQDISENNRIEYYGARNALIDSGYSPCGDCKP